MGAICDACCRTEVQASVVRVPTSGGLAIRAACPSASRSRRANGGKSVHTLPERRVAGRAFLRSTLKHALCRYACHRVHLFGPFRLRLPGFCGARQDMRRSWGASSASYRGPTPSGTSAATSIADNAPEHAGLIRDILDHATLDMAQMYRTAPPRAVRRPRHFRGTMLPHGSPKQPGGRNAAQLPASPYQTESGDILGCQ